MSTPSPESPYRETKLERQQRIWRQMTPEQRDYDRFVARQVPLGCSLEPETEGGRRMQRELTARVAEEASRGCTCHINPPCSFCVDGVQIEVQDA